MLASPPVGVRAEAIAEWSSAIEYRVLGPIEVRKEGCIVALGGPHLRNLLAMLLVDAGRVVAVDRLIDGLWGETPPKTALTALHGLVSRLRRALTSGDGQPSPLVSRPPGYVLEVAPAHLDLHEFERLVEAGRRAMARGDAAESVAHLGAAQSLWSGPALGGVTADVLTWTEVPRLEELRVAVLEDRIDAELALGRHAEVVAELHALVAAHPRRERLRAAHMLALYRGGRQAEALASYQDIRRRLREEVGLDPGQVLRSVEQAILSRDPGLQLRASRPAPPQPAQLPPDVADFTGREGLVAHLERVVGVAGGQSSTGAMVAAVSGKPGVGKTALVGRVAHRLRDRFPDGQLYAHLRGIQTRPLEPAGVLGDWLRVLGVEPNAVPNGIDARSALFRGHLADRRMLVVLDDAGSEAQVRPLLPAGPGCAVLVTSRRRLVGLEAARFVELDVLGEEESLELLARVGGSKRVADEPEAARAIATHCGHLPLAIRIAGSRLVTRGHLSLGQLATRLSHERGRLDELAAGDLEVRASLSLSYDRLDEHGRRALRLLGSLPGSDFAPWLAAAVLDASVSHATDTLETLVDRQLLDVWGHDEAGQVRYRFHDLLRAYARERLEADEAPASRQAALGRAQGACLTLAEQAAGRLSSSVTSGFLPPPRGKTPRWQIPEPGVSEALVSDPLARFAAERAVLVANIEAAASEPGDAAWELTSYLAGFFEAGAHADDWRRALDAALAAARRDGDHHGERVTLVGLGNLHVYEGRYDEAIACLAASLPELPRAGCRAGEALALRGLGHAYWAQGRAAAAVRCQSHCLTLVRALGEERAESSALHGLAVAEANLGRLREAEAHFVSSLHIRRAVGDRRGEAGTLHGLGIVHREMGDPDRAAQDFEASLAIGSEIGDRFKKAYGVNGLGTARRDQGRLDEAASLFEQALELFADLSYRRGEAHARHNLGTVAHGQGRLTEAHARLQHGLDSYQALGDRRGAAMAEQALGEVCLDLGRIGEAIIRLRAAVDVMAELELRLVEARARDSLALALAATGADDQARAERQRAKALAAELALPDAALRLRSSAAGAPRQAVPAESHWAKR